MLLLNNICFVKTSRVDSIAERIDTGFQQTLFPVVDQLHQNVRETLNIWNRPFSALISGHSQPMPTRIADGPVHAAPTSNQALPTKQQQQQQQQSSEGISKKTTRRQSLQSS